MSFEEERQWNTSSTFFNRRYFSSCLLKGLSEINDMVAPAAESNDKLARSSFGDIETKLQLYVYIFLRTILKFCTDIIKVIIPKHKALGLQ